MREFVSKWFGKAMTEADVNSRLMFFVQGFATAISVIVLSAAFIFVRDKSEYPMFVGVLCGGGVGSAFGRLATKWGNKTSTSDERISS